MCLFVVALGVKKDELLVTAAAMEAASVGAKMGEEVWATAVGRSTTDARVVAALSVVPRMYISSPGLC